MKKITFTFLFLFLTLASFAQQGLLFTHIAHKKEVLVLEGDLVKFSYNGYLGQKEVKYGTVVSIDDSIVGIVSQASSNKWSTAMETRFILAKDITGFRKFHRSRPYLISLSSIAITVGTVVLFYVIDKNTDLTFSEKLGLSIGSGIVSTLVVRAIFPERIKNKVGAEWELKVLK